MKNTPRIIAGAALLLVAVASTARADMKSFFNRCSVGAVRTCASLQVFSTLNASGGTDVTILVRNLQGGPSWLGTNTGGSLLGRIGLVTPAIAGASALTVTGIDGAGTVGNPSSVWLLRTPGGLGGLIELAAGLNQNGDGGIAGCDASAGGFRSNYFQTCNGGWVQITFSTTNAWSANNAEVAFLTSDFANVIGGVKGIECDTDNVATPGRGRCDEAFDTTVTPEPITMLLLGSGLASMGGMGLIRRRKGNDVTSS